MDEQLKLLGLNVYESKALLTLIHRGKSKASFISKESDVPYGKIYEVLDGLENKGLISIIPETVKYYQAKPIDTIMELVKEKKQELDRLGNELEELKKVEQKRVEGEIIVLRGKKNFHKILKERDRSKEFSYSIKWKADVADMNFQKRAKGAKEKGIKQLIIYDYNTPKENIKHWEKFHKKYKFIESDKIAMSINEHSVFILDVNLNSTILVKSKPFAHVMKQLYEGYYNQA